MNNRSSEQLPLSPWLGETAPAQWALWQAGNNWAATVNWFPRPIAVATLLFPIKPPKPVEEPAEPINP